MEITKTVLLNLIGIILYILNIKNNILFLIYRIFLRINSYIRNIINN